MPYCNSALCKLYVYLYHSTYLNFLREKKKTINMTYYNHTKLCCRHSKLFKLYVITFKLTVERKGPYPKIDVRLSVLDFGVCGFTIECAC